MKYPINTKLNFEANFEESFLIFSIEKNKQYESQSHLADTLLFLKWKLTSGFIIINSYDRLLCEMPSRKQMPSETISSFFRRCWLIQKLWERKKPHHRVTFVKSCELKVQSIGRNWDIFVLGLGIFYLRVQYRLIGKLLMNVINQRYLHHFI